MAATFIWGEAIDSLASVIAEIIAEGVRHLEEANNRKIKELPAKAADPDLNKRELAERLRMEVRTVDNWFPPPSGHRLNALSGAAPRKSRMTKAE